MERQRIKRVPILRDGRLVGIVSRADLLRQLLGCLDEDAARPMLPDDEIERRLAATLAAEGWAPRIGLRISARDGIVLLDGVIYDERERQALRAAAETIPGVRGVKDHRIHPGRNAPKLSRTACGAPAGGTCPRRRMGDGLRCRMPD